MRRISEGTYSVDRRNQIERANKDDGLMGIGENGEWWNFC
jgi:hypothetical protein